MFLCVCNHLSHNKISKEALFKAPMGQLPVTYHRSEAAKVGESHLVLCRRPCLGVLSSCVAWRAGPGALKVHTFIISGGEKIKMKQTEITL